MAEGWTRHLKSNIIKPYSAGIETHGLNPNAVKVMAEAGVDIAVVWNKSNREHNLIGTQPADQRAAAEAAVEAAGWKGAYHVDADHVDLATVDRFAAHCDFFTLDVAGFIGQKADPDAVEVFMKLHRDLPSSPGLPAELHLV